MVGYRGRYLLNARKCGPAFEELNKQEMRIPSDCQEFALGIGESRVDESHFLQKMYDAEAEQQSSKQRYGSSAAADRG